jgi:hypothetical protein
MPASAAFQSVLRAVAVGAAVVTLVACDVVVNSLDVKGRATDRWTRTYTVTAAAEVEIVNVNGGIEVVGGPGNQVEVSAERTAKGVTDEDAQKLLRQVQVVEQAEPSRVRLEMRAPAGQSRHLEVRYRVAVPAGANVRLETTNGTISASQLTGALSAATTNGSIRGRGLGGAVEASSTNGSVRLEVNGVAAGGVRANTVNGAVDLAVPASARAEVEASCVNGRIVIEGITLDGPEPTRRHVSGKMNGGGPRIALDTTNGSVRISAR